MTPNDQPDARDLLVKVPVIITINFWIIRILGNTVGETAAYCLVFNLNIGLGATSLVMSGPLAAFLYAQVSRKTYVPWLYRVTVVMVSIVGTLITDNLTDNLGIPLEITTIVLGVALVASFGLWYLRERSLPLDHPICLDSHAAPPAAASA